MGRDSNDQALVVEGRAGSAIACSFLDGGAFCSDSGESSEDEMEKVFNDNFRLHFFVGSYRHPRHVNPPGGAHVHIFGPCAYLSRPEMVGSVDVMELFGGEGVRCR